MRTQILDEKEKSASPRQNQKSLTPPKNLFLTWECEFPVQTDPFCKILTSPQIFGEKWHYANQVKPLSGRKYLYLYKHSPILIIIWTPQPGSNVQTTHQPIMNEKTTWVHLNSQEVKLEKFIPPM